MARVESSSAMFRVAAQKTVEATQAVLVKVAKREHAKVMTTSPRPVSFKRFVDGRAGALEESVKPNGVIFYQYPRLDLVAQYAMEVLFQLSPVLTGRYRISHTLFLNGTAVKNLKDLKAGDEVTISNPQPYSRKIEVGAMQMRVPGTDHVYEQAKRKVQARYGNIAAVQFTFRGFVPGAVLPGRAGNKADLRYPVLILSER
jgi:hypothetical protein